MPKRISMLGKKYNRLLVIKEYQFDCLCLCDCGKEVTVRRCNLTYGTTKSCGCLNKERIFIHGMSTNQLYKIWTSMKQRCENPNVNGYLNYGARGISVCNEWHDPKKFIEWAIDNNWEKGLQIDRTNNDGNYEPDNCKFVTYYENNAIGRKRKSIRNTSGFIGVCFVKKRNKWRSQINIDGKTKYIGFYETIEEAVNQRKLFEIEWFGKQLTNFKKED